MAATYFTGRRCAICSRPIDPPNAATLQPGFIDPGSHKVTAWDDVRPELLPDTIEHQRPLCANCTLAESFRQQFPDEAVERPPTPTRTLPPQ